MGKLVCCICGITAGNAGWLNRHYRYVHKCDGEEVYLNVETSLWRQKNNYNTDVRKQNHNSKDPSNYREITLKPRS